jgi:hypothetical protein
LSALIDRGDRQVGEIFAQYEADKDVYKLIDTLKALEAQVGSDGLFVVDFDDIFLTG